LEHCELSMAETQQTNKKAGCAGFSYND